MKLHAEQLRILEDSAVAYDRWISAERQLAAGGPQLRWMALHKLWLSDKPGRNVLKVAKDRAQGELLARQVVTNMRGFPVDREFRDSVPGVLQKFVEHVA